MRFHAFGAIAAVAAALVAGPASAVTFDAFSSFSGTAPQVDVNGNPTNGRFVYGEANAATPGTAGTFFTANSNCFIDGASCLQLAPNHDVPGFTKGGSPSLQYGTVKVPQDRLLAHPDDDSDLTFVAFVAPTAGVYKINAAFNFQDVSPTGITLSLITTTGGGLPLVFTPIGGLSPTGNSTFSFSQAFTLGASEAIGFGIGNGGVYFNDSTGVRFKATTVPEPATWAMMIGGVGLAGGSLRRRRRQSVSFA